LKKWAQDKARKFGSIRNNTSGIENQGKKRFKKEKKMRLKGKKTQATKSSNPLGERENQ